MKHNKLVKKLSKYYVSYKKWIISIDTFDRIISDSEHNLKSLERILNTLTSIMMEQAELIRHTRGAKGFFNGILEAFKDPIDGLKGIWGDSKFHQLDRVLHKRMVKCIDEFNIAIEQTGRQIEKSVNSSIDNLTNKYLDEIENEVDLNDKKTNSFHKKSNSQNEIYLKYTIIILLVIIVILLLILVIT